MLPTLKSTQLVGIETPVGIALPPTRLLNKQPGNNWDDAAFKKKHTKSQELKRELRGETTKAYQPMYKPKAKAGDDTVHFESSKTLLKCLEGTYNPQEEEGDASAPPAVLRFNGFFREAAVESAVETSRIRRVVVMVYLEDETCMVMEPRVKNSGIQGGVLVKRHRVHAGVETARKRNQILNPEKRIPSEEIEPGQEHLGPDDFMVGDTVTIYGKCIQLVSCDDFTRRYLSELGHDVPMNEPTPPEDYECDAPPKKGAVTYNDYDLRKTFEQQAKGRIVSHYPTDVKKAQKFLGGDAEVCRFWAYWDDRENAAGDFRTFEVRYYLQDGTCEVLERLPQNSGREPSRAFCKRRMLPKSGGAPKGTDLTFSTRANGYRHEVVDGTREEEYFLNDNDFDIGNVIDVYGRKLRIYTCDEWTRDFYQRRKGVELSPDFDVSFMTSKVPAPKLSPPRHNGFGTEEDSMGNCRSLVLKAPKGDFHKWEKYSDCTLRFKLKMHEPQNPDDNIRRFILSFFVSDDTLMINEVSVRNTGYLAGRFLKRCRVRKPVPPAQRRETPTQYYKHADIYPGQVLVLECHQFEVLEMDEFTEEFKKHQLFELTATDGSERVASPISPNTMAAAAKVTSERVRELMRQLRQAVRTKYATLTSAFRHNDKDRDALLPASEIGAMLQNMQIKATKAEVLAMMHYLDLDHDGVLTLNEFVAAVTGNTVKSVLDGEEAEFGTVDVRDDLNASYDYVADNKPREALRNRVLRLFKEKLEAKQINIFEMYRLLSTMPSSYKPRTGKDIASLASGGADSLLGPVQLKRGIEERFSFGFTEEETDVLMEFFFPDLPKRLYNAPREETAAHRLSLKEFQMKWAALERIGQLAPDMELK